jgi:hypothetical protein
MVPFLEPIGIISTNYRYVRNQHHYSGATRGSHGSSFN